MVGVEKGYNDQTKKRKDYIFGNSSKVSGRSVSRPKLVDLESERVKKQKLNPEGQRWGLMGTGDDLRRNELVFCLI